MIGIGTAYEKVGNVEHERVSWHLHSSSFLLVVRMLEQTNSEPGDAH